MFIFVFFMFGFVCEFLYFCFLKLWCDRIGSFHFLQNVNDFGLISKFFDFLTLVKLSLILQKHVFFHAWTIFMCVFWKPVFSLFFPLKCVHSLFFQCSKNTFMQQKRNFRIFWRSSIWRKQHYFFIFLSNIIFGVFRQINSHTPKLGVFP